MGRTTILPAAVNGDHSPTVAPLWSRAGPMTAAVQWPRMGRGQECYDRNGTKRFRPRRPAGRRHPAQSVHPHKMARTWYRRLLAERQPPPKALALLNALTAAGGEFLNDVVLTEKQLAERLRAGPVSQWGWSVETVRRTIRVAERLGYLTVEDRPIPGRGITINCYRLHVPATAADRTAWAAIRRNSKNAARRATAEAKERREAAQATADAIEAEPCPTSPSPRTHTAARLMDRAATLAQQHAPP
jgi:hypothetical protein